MLEASARRFSDAIVGHRTFDDRESVYVRWYPKALEAIPDSSGLFPRAAGVAGAYIHIPFCDRICRFCPFNKRPTDIELINAYLSALEQEILLYAKITGRSPLAYVYFGGGTPSTLTPRQVEHVLSVLDGAFGLSPGAEITLESHPSHIRAPFLRDMRSAGVNRFSSGLQSFNDALLTTMGAQHRSDDCRAAIDAATETDSYLAADFLFRCEGQSLSDWQSDLEIAVSAGIPHLSLYSLILQSAARQPDVAVEADMTALAHDVMERAGLLHYASCASGGFDFARPGYECHYELRHWRAPQEQFFGLGAGGIGYVSGRTTVNGLGIDRYITEVGAGRLPLVSAKLANREELMRRYFVLGFKTLRVDLRRYEIQFGSNPLTDFAKEFKLLTDWEFVEGNGDEVVLTKLGRVNCDMVSAMFFSREEEEVPHPEEPEIRRMELYGRSSSLSTL